MNHVQRLVRKGRSLARTATFPLKAATHPVFPALRRRRIDLCCCGLSKTGTHSIAGLFSKYRSEHHPDARKRLELAISWLSGTANEDDVQRQLEWRDRVLWLELESSTLAGALIEPLVAACPSKQFILTIRDVYTWCDSWIDHDLNSPSDATSHRAARWLLLDRIRLRVDENPPTKFDEPLTERHLPSLASLFQLWAAHNSRVLNAVPPARLLVVKTDEIIDRADEIAAWTGVDVETLTRERGWLASAPTKHRVLSTLDPSYVRETAERLCEPMLATYFPDIDPGVASG